MIARMLQSCQKALEGDDLFTIQHCVDRLAGWLVETGAPGEVRQAFCRLLETRADETANRVIAVYLRTVAENCRHPYLDHAP